MISLTEDDLNFISTYKQPNRFKKYYPKLFDRIIQSTSFLKGDCTIHQRLWHIKNNNQNIPKCKTCSEDTSWSIRNKSYNEYCNTSCMNKDPHIQQYRRQQLVDKHGVKNPMFLDQFKQKNLQSRKNRSPIEKTATVQKRQQTNLMKFGVKNILETIDRKIKWNDDVILDLYQNKRWTLTQIAKKLNVSYPSLQEHLKDINQPILFNKGKLPFDTIDILNDPEVLYKLHYEEQLTLVEIADKLGVEKSTISKRFKQYDIDVLNLYKQTSLKEQHLQTFISSILPNEQIQFNTKQVISPKELDIWIPSKRIAIEFCGLYWHSSKFRHPKHHYQKMKLCNQHNIRLITIFEDEWDSNESLVKTKLREILGVGDKLRIYGRKCNCSLISKVDAKRFLDQYHIQQSPPISITKLNVGLFNNSELIGVMTFTKRNNMSVELVRYATSKPIVGGFTKLLKFSIQYLEGFKEILSFSDSRWSEGHLYEYCGWTLDKTIPPDYSYVVNNTRVHKFNFRHKNLPKLLKIYDPNLSESKNCRANGIYKIYNCGLKKYIYSI